MITFILITYFLVTLAGSGILVHAVVYGPVGFEDEFGYHRICDPSEWELALAHSGSRFRVS
jgi:hypothetical protein